MAMLTIETEEHSVNYQVHAQKNLLGNIRNSYGILLKNNNER